MFLLNSIKLYLKKIKYLKKVCCPSNDVRIGQSTGIALIDGSTPSDVFLGHHVWLYGNLQSQSGGKIKLGNYVKIGSGCRILSVDYIELGDYTALAQNVVISDNNNHPINPDYRLYMRQQPEIDDSRLWKHSVHSPVIIGRNVWIGENVRIQKGVTIGDNSIIAANSVVTKDVPNNSIAAGNPAKIVKEDIDKSYIPISCIGFNEYIEQKK